MPTRETYSHQILTKEIEEIAAVVGKDLTEEVKQSAIKIALEYFEQNSKTDPETLARASFYIALKEYKCTAERNVHTLINNNGKKNSWWLYIVPLVEKFSRRK